MIFEKKINDYINEFSPLLSNNNDIVRKIYGECNKFKILYRKEPSIFINYEGIDIIASHSSFYYADKTDYETPYGSIFGTKVYLVYDINYDDILIGEYNETKQYIIKKNRKEKLQYINSKNK